MWTDPTWKSDGTGAMPIGNGDATSSVWSVSLSRSLSLALALSLSLSRALSLSSPATPLRHPGTFALLFEGFPFGGAH